MQQGKATYCFGVDIGGTTIKMGLFRTDRTMVDKWEIDTHTEHEGAAILPDVAASIEAKMNEHELERIDIAGIGIGVPAPVNAKGIVTATANLGWGYKEVKWEMEALTRMHVEVGNDANVAALGEMWIGAGQGCKNLIMVTLGTGVGGGVVVNGRPIIGEHGAGGEIGHICVNPHEQEKCGCGKKGCLEQYTSATGIARLAKKWLLDHKEDSLLREKEAPSAKDVFDALKEGDKGAKQIVEEFGSCLGAALANLAVLTDPAMIVIGGGVSKAGDILLTYVEKYFKEKMFFANEGTKFALARLGNDAGICGAAKQIIG